MLRVFAGVWGGGLAGTPTSQGGLAEHLCAISELKTLSCLVLVPFSFNGLKAQVYYGLSFFEEQAIIA